MLPEKKSNDAQNRENEAMQNSEWKIQSMENEKNEEHREHHRDMSDLWKQLYKKIRQSLMD